MPLREGDQSLAYCKVGWEYLAANIKIWPKLSDKCRSNHTHASQERMHEHAEKGRRTSQVCRRLLNALQFRAPNEGRLVSMPVSIPKGRVDRVIVTLGGAGDGFAERKGAKGCARIRCRNHWVPAHVKTSSSKRSANPAGTIFTRLCYSWHRFCDQVKDLERFNGLVWGESRVLGGSKRFRSVLKSLKRLLKKCAEFPSVIFQLTRRHHAHVGHGPNYTLSFRAAR